MKNKFDKLIIGLGNPGIEYSNTRHNVGFIIVRSLCEKIETGKFKKKKSYFISKKRNWIFILPRTFMNISGLAVKKVKEKYHINLENLLVILDDININLGKIKISKHGSAGGHKGMKSIIDELGSDSFPRLRIGIKPLSSENFLEENSLTDFVLSEFQEEERKMLNKIIPEIIEIIEIFLRYDYKNMLDKYSVLNSLSQKFRD